MAFDAITVAAMTQEVCRVLLEAKVDKIYQSEKDEIRIGFRTRQGAKKLLLSAGADFPRFCLTQADRQNPAKPPMFCMVLRKHLGGAKLVDVQQVGFERVVDFTFSCYDELGDFSKKHLMVEIMGRFSNVIFTDDDGKIIDSLKHINGFTSRVREVLPGLSYVLPPVQEEKIDPMKAQLDDFLSVAKERGQEAKLPKFLLNHIRGISPLIAREITDKVRQYDALATGEESYSDSAVAQVLVDFFYLVKQADFHAYIIIDKTDGRQVDFAPVAIGQYGAGADVVVCESLSEACETFYEKRDAHTRLKQKSSDLSHAVNQHLERCRKKILLQQSALSEADQKEQYREFGDLIMANIGRIQKGDRSLVTVNFYDAEGKDIVIPLDEALSPSQNAQYYYKKYNKLKVAQIEQEKQMKMAQADMAYLEEVASFIEQAQSVQDLSQIRQELVKEGYLKRTSVTKKNEKKVAGKPTLRDYMHFVSRDGFDIYVGKNSTQNDVLTTKIANASDWWFHTKNIPGSHTVIKLGLNKDVTDETLMEAAQIAAYYSKARGSSQIPVDYTTIKNVKKPNGAKPGMVIYDHYRTLYVKSDENLIKNLLK